MNLVQKVFIFFLMPCSLVYTDLSLSIKSPSAIVMDAKTGTILYQKQAHQPLFPASITKVATALFALEKGPLHYEKKVKADQDSIGAISASEKKNNNYKRPAYWLEFGGTHMGIKRGEILTLRDLFYGMMLISANDAANLIAKEVSQKIPTFVKEMNTYLKQIGCKNTHYKNPHGLHHPDHYSSAYDMALIIKEAIKHPFFIEIATTHSHLRPKTNKQNSTMMVQSNRLLRRGEHHYPPVILGKTGYHSDAKYNIVSVAENNERTLIAVVMNANHSDDRYSDSIKLYQAAFSEKKRQKEYLKAGNTPLKKEFKKGNPITLNTMTKQGFALTFFPSEEPRVSVKVRWKAIELPINKGEQVGSLEFLLDQRPKPISIPLYAANTINESLWRNLVEFVEQYMWSICTILIAAILFSFVLLYQGRRH